MSTCGDTTSMDVAGVQKRDAQATRERILHAAQCAFSETGYSYTGIRDIAARAGTSTTLLLRYFGSKVGLFEAALVAAMPVYSTMAWGKTEYPERLAAALLDAANTVRPPLMIAMAAGDPQAAAAAARVTSEHVLGPMSEWLGGTHARSRALAITEVATGFATYLRQLPFSLLAQGELEHHKRWFCQVVRDLIADQ